MNKNQRIKISILKIQKNERIKWEEKFPEVYGKKIFNGNNERNIQLAINDLKLFSLSEIRRVAEKLGLMYYISQNNHDDKWGLDKNPGNEGGGLVAQASSYEKCVKRAHKEFGINPIFIYGVGIDGW